MGLFTSAAPRDEKLDELTAEVRTLSSRVAALKGEEEALNRARTTEQARQRLAEEVERLTIERDRKKEEHDRRVREVEHATGLLRQQVEWERDKAVQEATLKVREENLNADRTRFEEQMEFHKKQIADEVLRFENLLTSLMERLPTVSVEKGISLEGELKPPTAARARTRG